MKSLFKKFFEKVALAYLVLVLIWVFTAFSFDCYLLYLDFTGQHDETLRISSELWRRIDHGYR
jgi:hypothetical protein